MNVKHIKIFKYINNHLYQIWKLLYNIIISEKKFVEVLFNTTWRNLETKGIFSGLFIVQTIYKDKPV